MRHAILAVIAFAVTVATLVAFRWSYHYAPDGIVRVERVTGRVEVFPYERGRWIAVPRAANPFTDLARELDSTRH